MVEILLCFIYRGYYNKEVEDVPHNYSIKQITMKQLTITTTVLMLVLLGTGQVTSAQTEVNTRGGFLTRPNTTVREVNDTLREARENIQQQRIDLRGDIKTDRAEVKTQMEADRQQFRLDMQATTNPEERRERAMQEQERRENYRSENAERRASYRAQAQGIISQKADLVVARYDAVIERVEDVLARIELKIDELQSEGIDVDAAVAFSINAQASLDAAEVDFQQAATLYTSIDAETMDREEIRRIFNESKAFMQAAKDDIQEAWSYARQAVTSLKASVSTDAQVEA